MMHPAQTSYSSKRVPLAVGIAVVLVIAALAIPIKARCGAPGYSCATAVDAQGNVHYYYEVEPLGVYLIESSRARTSVFTTSPARIWRKPTSSAAGCAATGQTDRVANIRPESREGTCAGASAELPGRSVPLP
jgi:hypothetical protein